MNIIVQGKRAEGKISEVRFRDAYSEWKDNFNGRMNDGLRIDYVDTYDDQTHAFIVFDSEEGESADECVLVTGEMFRPVAEINDALDILENEANAMFRPVFKPTSFSLILEEK